MPDDDDVVSGEVVDNAYDGPGEWLPAAPAALRLGVSERTLWRYVKDGQYQRRIVGKSALVWVPLAGSAPDTSETAMVAPATPDALSVAIIAELRRQHEDAVERLTRQAERIAELEREAGHATAALEASQEALGWTDARRAELQAELERLRARPWWKFW